MPLYSYTTAGSSVIKSSMLLSMVSVFSTLIGASVATGAWVGAAVAGTSAGASVACGSAGAAVGAAVPHAVRITSATEMNIIKGFRLDWYILFSSEKVVWELPIPINSLDRQKERMWSDSKSSVSLRFNVERCA